LRAAGSAFSQHPRRVVAAVVALTLAIWGTCLYSIASQIGHPFPGFLYAPDRLVSSLTPENSSGLQAGVRPRDYIVAVNEQPWQEMSFHGRWGSWSEHPPEDDYTQGEQE
jgi:hypothetical protein